MDKSEGQRSDWEYPFSAAGVNLTFMLQARDREHVLSSMLSSTCPCLRSDLSRPRRKFWTCEISALQRCGLSTMCPLALQLLDSLGSLKTSHTPSQRCSRGRSAPSILGERSRHTNL